ATVAFTLATAQSTEAGELTFAGELRGSNYASEIISGPVLTVIAEADAAVALTATPKLGLLVPKIEFKLKVTGNGRGVLRAAPVTPALPPGLGASPGACAAGAGTVTCTTGEIAPGASVTRTFSVPVGLLTIGVPYTFTATRTA